MVIMDLKRLQFLSSAGLRVIFKTKKKMDEHHGKFMLLNLQPQVRKVFDIIKALDGMNVFKSQEEMDEYLTAMQNKVLEGDN
jgi:anti-anti-sigma factor